MKNDNIASTSLKLFESAEWKVRVVMRDDEPWFVAKDVCECLAISDASQACKNLDDDEKQVVTRAPELSLLFRESSNAPTMTLISESGLYTLIMRSNKPEAKVFRKWVTSEVLPSIRKTGSYSTQSPMTDEEILSSALLIANRNLAIREERIKALEAERDEAVRTKYRFVEGRDAKICGELGGLRKQNEALRKQVGDSKTYKAVIAIPWLSDFFNTSNRGLQLAISAALKKIEADMLPKYAHIDIPDSRWGTVKAYHVAVVERLHEMVKADCNFMRKYRKDY